MTIAADSLVRRNPATVSDLMALGEVPPKKSTRQQRPRANSSLGSPVPADAPKRLFTQIQGTRRNFRQALVGSALYQEGTAGLFARWKSLRPMLLVERRNGQLLCVRLLDRSVKSLSVATLMDQLETVLPRHLEACDPRQLEFRIAQKLGLKLWIEQASKISAGHSIFSGAIHEVAGSFGNSSTSSDGDSNTAEELRAEQLAQQLDAALRKFRGGLDQRIVDAISGSGTVLDIAHYNGYLALKEPRRNLRLQAAEAFPLLGAILVEDRRRTSLREAVDKREPLVPALARLLRTPAEVVRWLIGKDAGLVGAFWADRLADLASWLELLCPEHRPRTARDWVAFTEFARAIDQMQRRNAADGREATPFFHHRWVRELGRMGWAIARDRFEEMDATPSDLSDIPDLVAEITGIIAADISADGSAEMLGACLEPYVQSTFFGKGILKQLRASLKWHRCFSDSDSAHDAGESSNSASLESWPAAFAGTMTGHGLSAICLTSRQQLKAEGRLMEHCVGTYAERCLFSGSTILSLRRCDGELISTAELALRKDAKSGPKFRVSQHKGKRNLAPPESAQAVLRMVVKTLNARDLRERRNFLVEALDRRRTLRRSRPGPEFDSRRRAWIEEALGVHVGCERFRREAINACQKMGLVCEPNQRGVSIELGMLGIP